MRSQDTTGNRQLCFPVWMAREIAVDLLEKQRLEAEGALLSLELEAYEQLVTRLEQGRAQLELQKSLQQEQQLLLETQLKAEKERRSGRFIWWLRLAGALGLGFLLGSL